MSGSNKYAPLLAILVMLLLEDKIRALNLNPISSNFNSMILKGCGTLCTALALVSTTPAAFGSSARLIGDIPTSGLIFKDSLKLNAFEDPKLPGITLYVSDFDRPITEKLSSDFFSDPSTTSLTCVQTGPVVIDPSKVNLRPEGEEIFEENRSLFFKVYTCHHLHKFL